jgi:hypothetical protein
MGPEAGRAGSFSQSVQANVGIVDDLHLATVTSSILLTVHYSLIIVSVNATQAERMTSSLNKPQINIFKALIDYLIMISLYYLLSCP